MLLLGVLLTLLTQHYSSDYIHKDIHTEYIHVFARLSMPAHACLCISICISDSYTTTARIHFISLVKQCQVTSVHRERTQKPLHLNQSNQCHMGRHSCQLLSDPYRLQYQRECDGIGRHRSVNVCIQYSPNTFVVAKYDVMPEVSHPWYYLR